MNENKKNTAARLVKSFRNKLRAGNRFLKNAIPYDSEDVRTSGTPLRSCLKNALYYSGGVGACWSDRLFFEQRAGAVSGGFPSSGETGTSTITILTSLRKN